VCALWHRAAGIIVYGNAAWRLCDLDLKVEPSGNNKILNRCCKAETIMSMKRKFDEDYDSEASSSILSASFLSSETLDLGTQW
jgi:hypothetical protein